MVPDSYVFLPREGGLGGYCVGFGRVSKFGVGGHVRRCARQNGFLGYLFIEQVPIKGTDQESIVSMMEQQIYSMIGMGHGTYTDGATGLKTRAF